MKNFFRAFRIALQYRTTFISSICCSLMVAVLWGGNITAIFPIVDVIMEDKSLPQWIDEEIVAGHEKVKTYQAAAVALKTEIETATMNGAELGALKANLYEQEWLQSSLEKTLGWFEMAQPYAEQYLPSTPFETLVLVCLVLLAGTLLKNAFRIASMILTARLGNLVGYELRKDFFKHTLRLDLADFNEQGRGDLLNRSTTDLNAVSGGMQVLIGQAVREPLKMIVCASLAAWVSWRLLLLTLVIAPLAGLLINVLAKSLKRANRRAMEELSGIYDSVTETLGGIKAIKAFTMEPSERAQFRHSAKDYYVKQMKIARYNSLVSPLTENLGILMVVCGALAGGYLVLNQETHLFGIRLSEQALTHGSMSLFFASLAGMSDPARRLSSVFNQLQQASASADRVYEILDREPTITDPAKPKTLPPLRSELKFSNVRFGYNPENEILHGVDLTVAAGETIAIVGPNGCGKSTLLNLLPRFYDLTQGAITIDGVDIRDVRLRELRSRIGIVTQETVLFNASVAENIANGRNGGATQEKIEQAARKAHAHRFITEKLTGGYENNVGPGGNNLSGGQRQRISLARAILRDPEILILDEATSQIDLESEKAIHETLKEFTRDRTTLIITHRMSTITLADRVVVMEKGIVLDIGTHDELAERCDLYRRLCHLGLSKSA